MRIKCAAPAREAGASAGTRDGRTALRERVFGAAQCNSSSMWGAMNYPAPPIAKLGMPIESFVAFLRDAPNDMPAYTANVLSDGDATDIYAFLQSLPGGKPAKDFPLLNQ
jgi:hypothetical protein